MSYTLVSAVVADPSGNLYAGGRWEAAWINQSTQQGVLPSMSGAQPGQFQTFVTGALDSFGNLGPVALADCNSITPGPSQWNLVIVNSTGKVSFTTLITITGASQNISAALQAAAASLITTFGGNSSFTSVTTGTLLTSSTSTFNGLLTATAGAAISGNLSLGSVLAKSIGKVLYIDDANTAGWAGADIIAQYASAEAALPTYGGTIDMRGLQAASNYSASGTWAIGGTGKAVQVLLPNQTIVITPTGNNPCITIGTGCSIIGYNSSHAFNPGGSSRLQRGGSGTGDLVQWTGSFSSMENVCFDNGADTGTAFHFLASGSNNVTDNKCSSIEISGNGGQIGLRLTAASNSALCSFNKLFGLKTINCGTGVQLDTSGTQGPTDNWFVGFSLESTIAMTASLVIQNSTTASNGFVLGHTSGTGPSLVTNGTGNFFFGVRTEATSTDVNDTGTGNSFIACSFSNATTSTFAASAVVLGGWSNTNLSFDLLPRGLNLVGAQGLKLGSGTALTGQTGFGSSIVTNTSPTIGGTVTEGRIAVAGTALTSAAVTGAGASATVAIAGNSTDSFGELLIQSAGAGPAATGTLTLNLSSALGSNRAIAIILPMSTDSAWNARASFQQTSNSTTQIVLNWDNNAVALVAGNNYRLSYYCFGR